MLTQNSILYKGMTKWHLLVTRSSVRDLGSNGEQNGMTTSLTKCLKSEAVKIYFEEFQDQDWPQNHPEQTRHHCPRQAVKIMPDNRRSLPIWCLPVKSREQEKVGNSTNNENEKLGEFGSVVMKIIKVVIGALGKDQRSWGLRNVMCISLWQQACLSAPLEYWGTMKTLKPSVCICTP